MNEEMSLEQLGAQAYAHYKAGEKSNQKANDHAKSAGLYLAEAKRRIDVEMPYGQRTQTFEKFLTDHCPLKRTRAEELIAVATGKVTEEEVRANTAARTKATRQRQKDSLPLRSDKVQTALPTANPLNPERAVVMARIIAKLGRLSTDQLHSIERTIPNVH